MASVVYCTGDRAGPSPATAPVGMYYLIPWIFGSSDGRYFVSRIIYDQCRRCSRLGRLYKNRVRDLYFAGGLCVYVFVCLAICYKWCVRVCMCIRARVRLCLIVEHCFLSKYYSVSATSIRLWCIDDFVAFAPCSQDVRVLTIGALDLSTAPTCLEEIC